MIEQWFKSLGFKDILLFIMGFIVVFMFIFNSTFNSNTGFTKKQVEDMKSIFQRRIDELNTENEILTDSIEIYKENVTMYLDRVAERQIKIDALEEKQKQQDQKIKDLIKQRTKVRQEIKNLDDEGLEKWLINYFSDKNLK